MFWITAISAFILVVIPAFISFWKNIKERFSLVLFGVAAIGAGIGFINNYKSNSESIKSKAEASTNDSLYKSLLNQNLTSAHKIIDSLDIAVGNSRNLIGKNDSILGTQHEVLLLDRELRVANERIMELEKEQNKNLKNKSELENKTAFNKLKRTYSDIFRRAPLRVSVFKAFTTEEQIAFINDIKELLGNELTNEYLISNKPLFDKWVRMYEIAASYTKVFPAGEVTQDTGTGPHKLSPNQVLEYNNSDFLHFVDEYHKFTSFMIDKPGIWF
jgi:hypothetical protein